MSMKANTRILLPCPAAPVGKRHWLAGVLLAAQLCGCGALPRLPAVPESQTTRATVLGSAHLRYWPLLNVDALYENAVAANEREQRYLNQSGYRGERLPPESYLAISGGGDDGAFGAGIMTGWTKHGDRPVFKVVTGVSAGALIAPFAFLGPDYDHVLCEVAVSIGSRDVFRHRSWLRAILSDAFADDRPLEHLIAKYVTPALLRAVAIEYARGRILLIGTTDLDSGQAVVWNMGAIASSDDPSALKLFRQIMLASSSIPGLFPPAMIDVMVNSERHQEMHVDGGVNAEVFLFPSSFIEELTAGGTIRQRERQVYIIRNNRIGVKWQSVPRRTVVVGRRALNGLINAQGLGELYELQYIARAEHESFHVAYIGADFSYARQRTFDTQYLRHLYDYAMIAARTGVEWHDTLPQVQHTADSNRSALEESSD